MDANGGGRPLKKAQLLEIADAAAQKKFGMRASQLRNSPVIEGWSGRSAEARRLAFIAEYAKT
ncbi:MAG TPA: hypothetical protein VIN70_04600 [Candidatus Limnocylindria bacterium]|jgi:hypothetical protein